MNWLDIALTIPLAWGLYKGFIGGFIMEIARIVSLIAGVYLAVRFAELLSEYLYSNTDFTTEFLPIISFAIIFIGVVLLVHFFAKAISKLVSTIALGWANKAAGAVFGIFRTAFLLSMFIMLLSRFELLEKFDKGTTAETSFLYTPVSQLAPFILPVLNNVDKDSVMDKVNRKVDKVEDALREFMP